MDCFLLFADYNFEIMRRFQGDKMPRRDENGRNLRIVNIGMQDPRIVLGPPVLSHEIRLSEQANEQIEQQTYIDPIRAIHVIAMALKPTPEL